MILMRVQYGEHFCPNVISCKSFPRGHFEKLMDVNHTPLPVVLMRALYGEHFLPKVISYELALRAILEK
jgi:hypothetical protein